MIAGSRPRSHSCGRDPHSALSAVPRKVWHCSRDRRSQCRNASPVLTHPACWALSVHLTSGREGLQRRPVRKEIGHTSGFPVSEARAVLWVSAGRCDPQGEAKLVGFLGTARPTDARSAHMGLLATRSELEPYQSLGGHGGRPPGTSRAPEGGGTTQRGDPAPGLMRCGTTASGEERMRP
jgi:hypothetical protein